METHGLKLSTSELNSFHIMLKKTNGRYIRNPFYLGGNSYIVDYTHDTSPEGKATENEFFLELYRLRNLTIKEKYSNQFIKTFFRRLKFWKNEI